jgi:hypothetical protein
MAVLNFVILFKIMKQYLFLILFFLLSFQLIAQDMSIEFSIEWKNSLDFSFKELKNEDIRPAYLNITYRNISDRPLYCMKIAGGKSGLPEIILLHNDYQGKIFPFPSDDGYCKRRYFVGFRSNPHYNMNLAWNIRNDTTDIEYKIIKETWKRPVYDIVCDGCPTGVIGGDTATLTDWLFVTLDNIYNFIYSNYCLKLREENGRNDKETYHYLYGIVQDTVMNNSLDKFVFLNPNEIYVDKYSLIGFQITGGMFTFQLDDTKSLDYVATSPVYEDECKQHHVKKKLSKKVGEYEFFTGEFFSNKIVVQFPGIKLKE